MITATRDSEGNVLLETSLQRRPGVYLDQDSLSDIAGTDHRRRRFLKVFESRGTLLFSWTNAIDLEGPRGRTADLIQSFLESIGPSWIPLEMNPTAVIRKERGEGDGHTSPAVSESFMRHYFLGGGFAYAEGPIHLGRLQEIGRAVDGAEKARKETERLKRDLGAEVDGWRKAFLRDSAMLDRDFPLFRFDATRPCTYVFNRLARLITSEARSFTWMPNDAIDFMHASVGAAYGDLILLDRQ